MGLATVLLGGDDAALSAYRLLLGADDEDRDGGHSWLLPNAVLRLESDTECLVLFGSDDVAADSRLLTRRGVTLRDAAVGARAEGLPLGIADAADSAGRASSPVGVAGIDHLVFLADDRTAAVALFGATFGLDYRLAQPIPGVTDPAQAAAVTQLFFRDGDLVVEVVAKPDVGQAVVFWGVAWRVDDLDASRTALCELGFDVSEIRAGRKPGTRVCTVRDRSLVVATLLIEHERS